MAIALSINKANIVRATQHIHYAQYIKAKEKKIPNIQAPFIDHIVMKNSEIIV